jgi:hypothetical protein
MARRGLETDIDEIAGFEHLLRCLGKARLVAIHGLHGEEAGQHQAKAKGHEQNDRAQMPGSRPNEQGIGETDEPGGH